MTRFLAFGWVRFVLAGALAFALAACFVGRADASSVFSSSVARPAASGAPVVAGDRALTLNWSAVKGAAAYRVSWRGPVLKGGKPTAAWSEKWLGLKVLKASARSYKATRLVNGRQHQLRLESKAKAKKSRWVVRSTSVASPIAGKGDGAAYVVGDTGPGGGKVFYAPGGTFTEKDAPCRSSCRYLEAAPAGWNSGGNPDPNLYWGGSDGGGGSWTDGCTQTISGAAGTGIGSGFANTSAIMAACPSADPPDAQWDPAALAASTYAPTVDGVVVTGWFLPSLDELNALDISSVGGLTPNVFYWSSSQYSGGPWWVQYVGHIGGPYYQGYNSGIFTDAWGVRPVRAW